MAWREITADDVLASLSFPEKSAYESVALATDQNAMTDILEAVVQMCRGYIGDWDPNVLAAGMTLPERAIRSAIHIMRVDLLTRLDLIVSDDRRAAQKDAIRFFERCADGKVAIEHPEGLETEESGAGMTIEVVNGKERLNTRENNRGL